MKDTAALKKAYEELEEVTNKYWSLYMKIVPEDSWLVDLINAFRNKNTYEVKYPTQNDDDIIRKFINSL